ncbi:10964_t:CDS:2 [Funneliformis geosporum]|nr:10964_t:CDS:2 [Funneliformis geosporum]
MAVKIKIIDTGCRYAIMLTDSRITLQKKENKSTYDFNLLYRASRDGNTPAAFHQKCDNKGANIVVIKISGTQQIVGGYNPFGWEGNSQWKSTKDSFIFSFINRTNLQTAKRFGKIRNIRTVSHIEIFSYNRETIYDIGKNPTDHCSVVYEKQQVR